MGFVELWLLFLWEVKYWELYDMHCVWTGNQSLSSNNKSWLSMRIVYCISRLAMSVCLDPHPLFSTTMLNFLTTNSIMDNTVAEWRDTKRNVNGIYAMIMATLTGVNIVIAAPWVSCFISGDNLSFILAVKSVFSYLSDRL